MDKKGGFAIKRNQYPKKDYKRLYNIYYGMKQRCMNPRNSRYKDYGGRGITICSEWLESVDNFIEWSIENNYEDNLTIDRINVNGNYEPDNCRWITLRDQTRNTRQNVIVEYKGEKKTLVEWCEELNLSYDPIHNRIHNGWPVPMAFEKPLASEYKSFSEICREHNIDQGTVRDRIMKFGWDYETALNTPTEGRGANGLTYNQEQFGYGNCKICGEKFLRSNSRQIYCGGKCRDIPKRKSYKKTGRVFDGRRKSTVISSPY